GGPRLVSLFGWSRVLRGVHSFPTRRSSDLAADFQCRPDAPSAARRRAKLGSALAAVCAGRVLATGLSAVVVVASTSAVSGAESGDRKSTRLNSSHVKISYAAFCLKKQTARG